MTLPNKYESEEHRWQAVSENCKEADEYFYYGVATTGVFCRPSCRSRLPKRENTVFFNTPDEAILAGYRPCRRCFPNSLSKETQVYTKIIQACRTIEQSETPPSLAKLAAGAGLSKYHFHRLFKKIVGLTPKQYTTALRSDRFKQQLRSGKSVTDALYAAGYGSASTMYAETESVLGMKPDDYRQGARGFIIFYAIAESALGWIIAAATDKGICAIEFADNAQVLPTMIQERFPEAKLQESDSRLDDLLARIIRLIESPGDKIELPLDIRGTAFQQQVWNALRKIKPGATISYSELARKLGKPRAVRAVASACAANKIAVAIPCHRAVSKTGKLSGYRWGIERKQKLLDLESKDSTS